MNLSEIKYPQTGVPFQIRANMSGTSGKFLAFGEFPLGKRLTITPIAYRVFRANLFQKREDREAGKDNTKTWLELFFPYEHEGHTVLACLSYHSYSVDNFINAMKPFMYKFDENGNSYDVTDLTIECSFKPHKNADGNEYYIGEFEITPADRKLVKAGQELADSLDIYRSETVGSGQTLLQAKNYPDNEYLSKMGLLNTSAAKTLEIEEGKGE